MKNCTVDCVDLLRRTRTAFQAGRTAKESFRLAQLEAVVRMLEEHEWDFVDALERDLHKVRSQTSDQLAECLLNVMLTLKGEVD